MKIYKRSKTGFTLIEMIIVFGIIIIVLVGVFISRSVFQAQRDIEDSARQVEDIFQAARAFSLSGQSYPDINDYDGDGDTTELVVPFAYISVLEYQTMMVDIDYGNTAFAQVPYISDPDGEGETSLTEVTYGVVSLWADLKGGTTGVVDEEDILISEKKLSRNVDLLISTIDSANNASSLPDFEALSVVYKTPNASVEFSDFPIGTSVEIKLQIEDSSNNVTHSRFLFLHSRTGIPEAGTTSIFAREENYLDYEPPADSSEDGYVAPSLPPPTDEPPADEPPTDEPPADEPPTDEPPADEPPADEPPADEPPPEKSTGDYDPNVRLPSLYP